jgi:hypothetical protein
MHSSHLRDKASCFTWGWHSYIIYLDFCMWDLLIIPIYIFFQSLFISLWMHSYFFYALDCSCNAILLILLLHLFWLWPLGALSVGTCFLWPLPIIVGFSSIYLLWHYKIFQAPFVISSTHIEKATALRFLVSFRGESCEKPRSGSLLLLRYHWILFKPVYLFFFHKWCFLIFYLKSLITKSSVI